DVVLLAAVAQPLVMVVDGDRKRALGRMLPDHVLVEDRADLGGCRQLALLAAARALGTGLVTNDVVAKLDAFIADEHRRSGDQLAHFVLALAAERAIQQLLARSFLVGHTYSRFPASLRRRRRGLTGLCRSVHSLP